MAAAGLLKSIYLRYFSQPVAERILYRAIARHKFSRIVELGIGQGVRTRRIIELAVGGRPQEVRYTGIDLFEARDAASPGLTLKAAHQQLRPLGAKVQLVPGDSFSALARVANSLSGTQLLIVSADQDPQSLERAWFYVPRMLADDARIFLQRRDGGAAETVFEEMKRGEILTMARCAAPQRKAA